MSVLALDIGSSSVRAQRFDERGEPEGELRQEKYDTNDADGDRRLAPRGPRRRGAGRHLVLRAQPRRASTSDGSR